MQLPQIFLDEIERYVDERVEKATKKLEDDNRKLLKLKNDNRKLLKQLEDNKRENLKLEDNKRETLKHLMEKNFSEQDIAEIMSMSVEGVKNRLELEK